MLFYFVRHGQTEANASQKLQGSGLDSPLNVTGHSQARQLASALKAVPDFRVHRVIASEMTRARETATYIAQELGVPLEVLSDWQEWHLGEWEGQSAVEFLHLLLGDGEPRAGERRQAFYARVERAWRSVHSDTHPYLVVSHGAVWMALQDFLKIPRFKVSNCDLVRVECGDGTWRAQILRL